jgi:hypothetical protein
MTRPAADPQAAPRTPSSGRGPMPSTRPQLSAKAKGEVRRQTFLGEAANRGISLRRIKGVRYSSPALNCVGIASASESPSFRNRWFLGLAPDDYDSFVLLCEDLMGHVYQFIASPEFARPVLPRLSRDTAGQIKFHVTREAGQFYLDVPGSKQVPIDSLLESYVNLAPSADGDPQPDARQADDAQAGKFEAKEKEYLSRYRNQLASPDSLPSRIRNYVRKEGRTTRASESRTSAQAPQPARRSWRTRL